MRYLVGYVIMLVVLAVVSEPIRQVERERHQQVRVK